MDPTLQQRLAQERKTYRAKIDTALEEDPDPLTAYDAFVNWTLEHYPQDQIAHSGLLELLEEATRKFKDDAAYRGDLRYLKLWALYASHVEDASVVYTFLFANGIGTMYALTYWEYAAALERKGKRTEAETAYKLGIKRRARPVDPLKRRYEDFKNGSGASTSSNPDTDALWKDAPAQTRALRRDPFMHYSPHPFPSSSSSSTTSSVPSASNTDPHGSARDRYALMLAPPPPGKRPEKLRFTLSLLFTDDGVEYSMQEARARAMGLLGKKWLPPPSAASLQSAPSKGGRKEERTRTKTYAEPTMTLATREAMADVFGMYNAPEATVRYGAVLDKDRYKPVEIEPITPSANQVRALSNENANKTPGSNENAGMKIPAFRPYVDENANAKSENVIPAPPKFKPFVDPEEQSRQPVFNPSASTSGRRALAVKETATPAPTSDENACAADHQQQQTKLPVPIFTPSTGSGGRRVLGVKETATTPAGGDNENRTARTAKPHNIFKPVEGAKAKSVGGLSFSVFTPAPQDARDRLQLQARQSASSGGQARSISPEERVNVFKPMPLKDEDADFPANIFSRLPARNEKANAGASGKAAFKPYVDENAANQSRARPILSERVFGPPPTQDDQLAQESSSESSSEGYEEQYEEGQFGEQEYFDQGASDDEQYSDQYDEPTHTESRVFDHTPVAYQDEGDSMYEDEHHPPLGGRFGQFDVMTPITERTYEYTMSTRGSATPSQPLAVFRDPVETAEQLAAELRAEDEDGQNYDVTEDLVSSTIEKTGSLSLTDALNAADAFKPPNPCNPFDPPIVSTLLSLIQPERDADFHDLKHAEANQLDALQKFAKKRTRRHSGNTTGRLLEDAETLRISLADRQFAVVDKLGEGGFGAVFEAIDLDSREHGDEDDEDSLQGLLALKVVKPRNLWEFHVLRRMHRILPPELCQSIILPQALYAFRDESFLVLELCRQGTLLDIVNRAGAAGISQQGACLDELLVIFFTIELMRLLEGLHRAGFIHGDVKIDNCLLRLEDVPGPPSAWTSVYQPSGEGGWKYKGIKMIDFGRTIDTALFPAGQQYIAEWPTDARDCLEIREGRPWTFQTDYFGLAGIIYCMLYGKYIEASSVVPVPGEQRYRLAAPLKRYWQVDLWTRLFDLLLNPSLVREDGQLPICDELAELRIEMEEWLQTNCNRASNSLKGLLKKIGVSILGG
ncbi:hypothetical protein WOLCODRAFT_144048 [Wolfiporia cocos MD-104 SS10]|uniref:Kinase-like protein n=1 Tax=Wolfiporia cocos (strain MD-104) TaxID=742152 RepID=A0A2H3JLM2_WOLCO|nr:hypothetical protein WOLCODRAFT_144048 [Wolfiporia cocos MD-104 SS10]